MNTYTSERKFELDWIRIMAILVVNKYKNAIFTGRQLIVDSTIPFWAADQGHYEKDISTKFKRN
jgi:hypothetical protein